MIDELREGFIFPKWQVPRAVQMAITTRRNGFSAAPFAGLNVSDNVGDDPQAVDKNRCYLHDALSLPSDPLWLQQQHASDVLLCESNDDCRTADASISFESGYVCAVMTADCLPVLFCDKEGTRVGVAHAGWRGLLSGVLDNTAAALDCPPQQLCAWLGPAIGPDAFQVGDDVRDAFVQLDSNNAWAFLPDNTGYWLCDIYQLARIRLRALGLVDIYGGSYCTYRDSANFYSYRRDGVTGRIAALAWLQATP